MLQKYATARREAQSKNPSGPLRKPARHAFLKAWIRSPLSVGAVMPSSRQLANAMAGCIDTAQPGVVVELGAGTGVITAGLLRSGMDARQLIVLERDAKLHAFLHTHFPLVQNVRADACELAQVLQEMGAEQVNAIVSSLPLLSMPLAVRNTIIKQITLSLGEAGILVQFTYGPKSPIPPRLQRRYRLAGKCVAHVWFNLPPAHVWVYQKQPK